MCNACNEKWQMTSNWRNGTTKSSQETYKYLGILEADTLKQVEMKEKFKKNIPGELENYSRQNSPAETLSKE